LFLFLFIFFVQIWKSLETTEKTLVDMIQVKDYDITRFFMDESGAPPRSPHEAAKYRSDRIETESYYLEVKMAV
jgi:SLIT-ROBO Rho GTPase activating protein